MPIELEADVSGIEIAGKDEEWIISAEQVGIFVRLILLAEDNTKNIPMQ